MNEANRLCLLSDPCIRGYDADVCVKHACCYLLQQAFSELLIKLCLIDGLKCQREAEIFGL